jgi:predicted RNase H-like nuclease (RuvC/YqgF family)
MISFPIFKIGLLIIKQISKPIAKYVKTQATEHPLFRRKIIQFAQAYQRAEIKLKRRQAEVQRPEPNIMPLDDKRAIDLAASFISESIIFGAAVAAVVAETYRKRLDDTEKRAITKEQQDKLENTLKSLEEQIKDLKDRLERQEKATTRFPMIFGTPSSAAPKT